MAPGTVAAADAGSVAGHVIRGVITPDEVEKLPDTTAVCALGSVSGVHCGRLELAHPGSAVVSLDGETQPGDSGGPVFALDSDGHSAVIVGVISQASGTWVRVAYAAPIIATYSLTAPGK